VLCGFVACRRAAPSPPPPLVAQVSGTIEVSGLSAPVRIVRDRWGVPHVYGQSQDDLFFAQGFVQAQDRLFQMDLWRRSAQGRLAEVLGPNFIERDAMTRRIQYRGDLDVEWASYGPDTKTIAEAFVRGINAWVALARERQPEEFVLAGWKPDFWSAVDLLNRTDAFVDSGDAIAEVRRAKLSEVIAEALKRIGAPPFFAGLAADIQPTPGSEPAAGAAASADRTVTRSASRAIAGSRVLSISEARRSLNHPSPRYFIHLHAPGWNVAGATSPWRPGVAVGHNDEVAWAAIAIAADTQDVFVDDELGAADRTGTLDGTGGSRQHEETHTISDAIVVKGRSAPFPFDTDRSTHGVVIASDREHHRRYALRWSGFEPGAAAELGALAVNRARTWAEFRTAIARWKMPARRVVYADSDGNIGYQDAALVPIRRGGNWRGWIAVDDLPHVLNPRDRSVVAEPPPDEPPSTDRTAVFAHVFGITEPARRRFNVGPMARPDADDATVFVRFDAANWDRSTAMNAPGQSESPASTHFSDAAKMWTAGERFPLAFSEAAVKADAESTLTLVPVSRPR